MLSSGDTAAVRRRMESVPAGSSARQQADFYGNFYLGLYADAGGDRTEALRLAQALRRRCPAPLHGGRRPSLRPVPEGTRCARLAGGRSPQKKGLADGPDKSA